MTTVLDTIATNIASSRPLSASSTSRWVIAFAATTGASGADDPEEGGSASWVTSSRFTSDEKVADGNFIPDG
ncbi:hypothetical protein GCM10009562_35090 [Nocardioides aquaticus]